MVIFLVFVLIVAVMIYWLGFSKKKDRINYLFSLYGDNIEIKNVDKVSKEFEVHFSDSSKTHSRIFSDIPQHISRDLGSIEQLNIVLNISKNNPQSDFLSPQQIQNLDATGENFFRSLENHADKPFIEQNPNCSLSFHHIENKTSLFIENISYIISSTKNTDGSYTMKFKSLTNLPEEGTYDHVSIVVDDWSSYIGFTSTVIGTAAACTAGQVLSFGTSTGFCVAGVLSTTAQVIKIVGDD